MDNTPATITSAAIDQASINKLGAAFMDYCGARNTSTALTYAANLKQFFAYLTYKNIVQPTRSDVQDFMQWLMSDHPAIMWDYYKGWKYRADHGSRYNVSVKPGTANQYLQTVKAFFKWTQAAGLYPNVAESVKPERVATGQHRREALDVDAVAAIEESIDRSDIVGKRNYAMYLLAVNAGLRTVELSRARIRDIGETNGKPYIYVWGKGHSEPDTKKPIAKAVYKAILEYLEERPDGTVKAAPLFASHSNRTAGQPILARTIGAQLKGILVNAGYNDERLTAHSLRHTAATTALKATGSNIYQVQQYMRHSSPATTEIYLHDSQTEEQADIADRVYNLYHHEKLH